MPWIRERYTSQDYLGYARFRDVTERYIPNGKIALPSKDNVTSKHQCKMRVGTIRVLPITRATFLSAEWGSSTSRVSRCVFDPRLPGFDPESWPYVLDGTRMDTSGREAISVQGSRFSNGLWVPEDAWYTIERFGFDPSQTVPAARFIAFQARHYGDVRVLDPHLGTLGGAGLRAWNGTVIGEYSSRKGGEFAKHVSRFRLAKVSKCFARLWSASTEGYDLLVSTQSGIGPIPDAPYFFAWSLNLGNSMHLDADYFQSFATFMLGARNTNHLGFRHVSDGGKTSWWLLFPLNGVAVKLGDGVGVTWPGYAVPHCSSIPLHTNDCLSMFTSQSQALEEAFVFQEECELLYSNQELRLTLGHEAHEVGSRVAVRVKNKWALSVTGMWWERHDVVHVGPHGGVMVKKRGKHARSMWVEPRYVVKMPW